MGTECACLGQDAIKAEAKEKENQNSKFFYYSDPQLLAAFNDKLTGIQRNIEQQKRLRETMLAKQTDGDDQSRITSSTRHWNEPSRLSRKQSLVCQTPRDHLQTTLTTQASSQLRQIESRLQKESFQVLKNLDIEKQSGWNEAVPSRLVLEVGQVNGLWNTCDSWFQTCRSLVQVEYAGTCINSKPNINMKDPHFAELFIFPVTEESNQMPENLGSKVFISIFSIEGKSDVPDPNDQLQNHITASGDQNVYKRIAEYCLDIGEICDNQLVHELTLSLPVKNRNPQAGPLFHPLRHCNISGLYNDQASANEGGPQSSFFDTNLQIPTHSEISCFDNNDGPQTGKSKSVRNLMKPQFSPPIKKENVPQRDVLPVFTTEQQPQDDFSILDMISEIDEPLRIRDTNGRKQKENAKTVKHSNSNNVNRQLCEPTPRRGSKKVKCSTRKHGQPTQAGEDTLKASSCRRTSGKTVQTTRNQAPVNEWPQQQTPTALAAISSLKTFEQNLQQMLPSGQKSTSRAMKQAYQQSECDVDFSSVIVQHQVATGALSSPMQKFMSYPGDVHKKQSSRQAMTRRASNGKVTEVDYDLKAFQTPNDRKSRRKGLAVELENCVQVYQKDRKYDSPVKAVPWEDALGKPCRSFSFDEDFKLDSDYSTSNQPQMDDHWSPVAMGGAPLTLDSRVSPLKLTHRQSQASQEGAGLLGGVFPVLHAQGSPGKQPLSRVYPDNNPIVTSSKLVTAEEAALAATSDTIKVNLRIQYLQNATNYLIRYKEKLQKTNEIMKQLDTNCRSIQ